MRIFDTHAHYSDKRFDEDRDALLPRLSSFGVELVLDVACDLRSTEKTFELLDKYAFVYGAVGMHPHYAADMNNEYLDRLKEQLSHEKMLALGEIGLDYYYDFAPREVQKEWFDKQLSLAAELKYPVILHVRDAMGDCLDVLRAHRGELLTNGGVMHCFSGSAESARECLDLGLMLGFGGSLTFKNNRKGVETAAIVPLDRFVFETDCPYLAPVPHRGERNDSSLIPLVAEKFAEIKGISPEAACEAAFINGLKLFRMEVC